MRCVLLAALAILFASNNFAYALGGSTCLQATVVGSLPYNDGGQLESGFDLNNCFGEPVNDLFYVFTAPSADTFRFDMCGSNSCCFQQMRIWTAGTCCIGASATINSGCVDGYPQLDLAMTSGQVVFVEVGKSGGVWDIAPLYQFQVTYVNPPRGGTCATAMAVVQVPYADSGLLELGPNDDCSGGPVNDVLYRFTAPNSGYFRFDLCGSDSCCDHQMRIWTDGTCCNGASLTVDNGCADGKPQTDLAMTAGQIVFIEIGKSGSSWANPPGYQFHVTDVTQGATCDRATVVGTLPYVDSGQLQTGANDDCSSGPIKDKFYVFTAPSAAMYTFDMCGSDNCCQPRMRLWTGGTCCSGASQSASDQCADGAPQHFLELSTGQTVYIEVGVQGAEPPTTLAYQFRVTSLRGATCTDAIAVGVPLSARGFLDPPGYLELEGGPKNDVFFHVTVPYCGVFAFNLCGSQNGYDFQMRVWEDGLYCSGTEVIIDGGCYDGTPTFEKFLNPGQVVIIEIGVDSVEVSDRPSYVLEINRQNPSDNDAFSPITFNTVPFSDTRNLSGLSDPQCWMYGQLEPVGDVWYQFAAPYDGVYQFDLCGSAGCGNTLMRAWFGPPCLSPNADILIGCQDGSPLYQTALTAGQTLRLQIGTPYFESASTYHFNASDVSALGANCASALQVGTLPFSVSGPLDWHDSPLSCTGSPNNDIFFVFTAPETEIYRFDMLGSEPSFNASMKIWLAGTCCVGVSDTGNGLCVDGSPQHDLWLSSGQTVYVELGVAGAETTPPPTYQFHVTVHPGSSCADAIIVDVLPYAVTAPLDPPGAPQCTGGPSNEIFYLFIAPDEGVFSFDMCGSEPSFDAEMKLWRDGSCCAGASLVARDTCPDGSPKDTLVLSMGQLVYIEIGAAGAELPAAPTYQFQVAEIPQMNCQPLIVIADSILPYFYYDLLDPAGAPECSGGPENDVFYQLTASHTGLYTFSLCGTQYFQGYVSAMRVWLDGICCEGTVDGSTSACSFDGMPEISLVVDAGQTIIVEVGYAGPDEFPTPLAYQLAVSFTFLDCANHTVVEALPYYDSGLLDAPGGSSCPGGPGNDLMYKFLVPDTGIYRFDMCGSDSCCDYQMRFWWNGVCCQYDWSTTDSGCVDGKPQVDLNLLGGGNTLFIEVGTSGAEWLSPPNFQFHVTELPPPADCASARIVDVLPYSYSGSLDSADGSDCPIEPVNDQFFRFVAPYSSAFRFDMCGSDSGFNYQMRFWASGCCYGAWYHQVDSGCGDGSPLLIWPFSTGSVMDIEVGITGEELPIPPDFQFHVTDMAQPHGTCAGAFVIGDLPFSDSGLLDMGGQPNCPTEPENDFFYRFTAPHDGTFRFDMCGSPSCCDHLMRLWTDGTCCGGNSASINSGCVDSKPRHELAMSAGQVVYIEIGKSGFEWGIPPTFQLNVSEVPCSTPVSLSISRSSSDVRLVWISSDCDSYLVYRATTADVQPIPANRIATTPDTTYTDTGILSNPELKFFYTVTATN